MCLSFAWFCCIKWTWYFIFIADGGACDTSGNDCTGGPTSCHALTDTDEYTCRGKV